MIEQLIDGEFAYEVDGDVYYRVARFPEYGQLSGQRPDKVEEQEPNPRKEDPRDFALWKANKPGEDTSWDSPWGKGRPGWHIECSAMSEKHLGTEFEVHGAGSISVFPHHENELRSPVRSATGSRRSGCTTASSASAAPRCTSRSGNVVTLRDALATWGRETLLLFYATGHWRKPLDFTDQTLRSAAARAEGFRDVFRAPSEPAPEGSWERFAAALDDDFNTPEALAILHEWRDHDLLRRALEIFGLESLAELPEAPPEVVELARERARARAEKRFDDADELRKGIEEAGWIVRDSDAEFQLVPRS